MFYFLLQVINKEDEVCIIEGHLKIRIVGLTLDPDNDDSDNSYSSNCIYIPYEPGYISFEIIDAENEE